MKYTKYLLLILPMLSSCTKSENVESERIALTASIVNVGEVVTKAATSPLAYTGNPSASNPLEADIWFSTTSGSYPGTAGGAGVSDTSVDTHRTIEYTSDGLTYPSDYDGISLRYPSGQMTIYCVGMAPQDAWSTDDGRTITAEIDGNTDLMFAPEIHGSSSDVFSTAKPQTYKHELTWLKVRVRAEEDETAYTWGTLTSITITGKDKATVDLSSGAIAFSNSGAEDKTYVLFDGEHEFTTTSIECGSIILAPVTAGDGNEYTLHVVCEKDAAGRDVPVDLVNSDGTAFSGSTAGKVFVVNLYFQTRKYIESDVSMVDLTEDNRSLILD